MYRSIRKSWILLAASAFCMLPSASDAGPITFTIAPWNISNLVANQNGPFALAFQLTDGAGIGNNTTTVTVSNINLGNGSAGTVLASPFTLGGASGNLSNGITLHDSSPYNELAQGFTPGSTLGFTVTINTTRFDSPIPDDFSVLILQGNSKTPLPTEAALGEAFITVPLNGPNPTIGLFGTSESAVVDLPAPHLQIVTVPEPTTLALSGIGIAGLALSYLRRRARR